MTLSDELKITIFQNKMITVAYYLLNAFGISTKPKQQFDEHYLKIETVFLNNKNSKTNERHRVTLSAAD